MDEKICEDLESSHFKIEHSQLKRVLRDVEIRSRGENILNGCIRDVCCYGYQRDVDGQKISEAGETILTVFFGYTAGCLLYPGPRKVAGKKQICGVTADILKV